jgi:hypothetical protein
MNRDQRTEELYELRLNHPARLIGLYRTATDTPLLDNLPRGLGFTGMIEAILDNEFPADSLPDAESQRAALVSLRDMSLRDTVPVGSCLPSEPVTLTSEPVTLKRRWNHAAEMRAFCSGATMVLTGLFMAAMYFVLIGKLAV